MLSVLGQEKLSNSAHVAAGNTVLRRMAAQDFSPRLWTLCLTNQNSSRSQGTAKAHKTSFRQHMQQMQMIKEH